MRQLSFLPSEIAYPAGTFLAGCASFWRVLHFAALTLVVALSPSLYDRPTRSAIARHIHASAWRVLPWFAALSALLGLVLIRIVVVTADSYGLSPYALEMVVRVLVLELIPLTAALFVAMRSGAGFNTEVALMHERGELLALRGAGGDPIRSELVPRVIGSAVAVVALAAVSGSLALLLAYLGVYGFSPWGLSAYTLTVGQVFDLAVSLGLVLKTLFFSLAVAVIPIAASLEQPQLHRAAPGAVLLGMVRLFLVLLLIEGASLAVKYV